MARSERVELATLFFGSIWLWQWVFGWHGWETFYAIGLSMVTTLLLGLAGEAIRETWPLGVPYELRELVGIYENAGWKRTRIHPWWQCHGRSVAKAPHVHLMQGRQPLIVSGNQLNAPRTRLPEGY